MCILMFIICIMYAICIDYSFELWYDPAHIYRYIYNIVHVVVKYTYLHTYDFKRDWWWFIGWNIVVCITYAPITDKTTYDYYKCISKRTDGPYYLVRILLPYGLQFFFLWSYTLTAECLFKTIIIVIAIHRITLYINIFNVGMYFKYMACKNISFNMAQYTKSK